ncbi:histidine kinase [Flavilitoribacter nigricans DSM 23189 = NBRC 102662]|uniref:Histidine kinase n=2 Tax=Flavilitoribacter TaxID=2762562 RepID=A0A2D0N638_FLAN2|nr:histidine kinase [Flavilitoribacter nigricans DSM 23189 = NBRC 102662]
MIMNTIARVDIRARLYEWLTQRVVYHSLFWLTLLMILTLRESVLDGFWFSLSNQIINVFFYALIVYFNLFYLIPNYLTRKKFLTYGVLLVLFAIIVTPLKVIVFYFKFGDQPSLQADLIEDQNLHFLFTFFIVGASTIVKIVKDWAQHLREMQELETQTMQSELRFLKSQINPHFLFNTLNNLYALTLKKSDQAPEIVIKLSEMMRYMLYECNEKRVPLRKEVNYIRNYLDLEQLRQGKNIEINFMVEGQVSDQEIAPLMFIPFLENSFKHGLSNHITKGFVNIKLSVKEQCVDFYIENSKPETPPVRDPNRRSGGIGLVNIHRRLNLLYPDNYELKIEDMPHAYAVHLKIKLM